MGCHSLVSADAFLKLLAISLIVGIFSCSWNITLSLVLSSDSSMDKSFKTSSGGKQAMKL